MFVNIHFTMICDNMYAGITVECSDVIIDLNGHTIGMSEEFYLQQRFLVF